MPQISLEQAQRVLGQVVENPDGPATQAISTRQIAEAAAVVLIRTAPDTPIPSDG